MNTDTDTIAALTIAVDFGRSLPDMIAVGKYDSVNPAITPERFPVEGTGTKKFRTRLFHFGGNISSQGAITAMQNENITPATHVHGLAFGATFREEQRTYPIACLGSSARVGIGRGVVYLHGRGDVRDLDLFSWLGDWSGRWRFLGVQEVCAT
jgi:hypothetical protein